MGGGSTLGKPVISFNIVVFGFCNLEKLYDLKFYKTNLNKVKQIKLLFSFTVKIIKQVTLNQCLGASSVESKRFWLPRSGSAKIVRSKEQNISQTAKKNTLKTQIWTVETEEIMKISWSLNGSSLGIRIS